MKKRKNRYLSSLANGYLLLVIQVVVSLVQVPLALDYLGKERFGLWAVIAQIALWFQLLDLGMNGAVARHLIDYVGGKDPENLKRCLATGFRVLIGQGFIVVLVTLGLAFWGAPLFGITGADASDFKGVLLILGLTSLIRFSYKILSAWLYALQRLDVVSGIGSILVVSELAIFWWLLVSGFDIYALAWARIGVAVLGGGLYVIAVSQITAFPWRMLIAPFDQQMFGKLAVFGGGMFVLMLGSQLLTMSQTAMVSNRLGLAAAAVWATAPKAFMLASQALTKLWDYRIPYLSVLMAEGKKHEIHLRFVGVFKATAYLGGGAIGGLAAINQSGVS